MTTEAQAVWQEPVRGEHVDARIVKLTGNEQMQWYLDHQGPIPPIAHLSGLRFDAAADGQARFSLPVTRWLQGPKGTVHAGMFAFCADAALGTAVGSVLPPRTGCTTAELSMTFLRSADPAATQLVADAGLVDSNGTNALAQVRVTDDVGTLVAHGTSRYFIFPVEPPDDADPAPPQRAEYDTPDPYLRDAPGSVLGEEAADRSGLDLLIAQVEGRLPLPPIHHLTGIRPVEAAEGEVVFTLPASGWQSNLFGIVYGGSLALLAKSAVAAAAQTLAPPDASYSALDLKVNFLRPVLPDDGELTARGRIVHAGRNLAIGRADVVDQRGKTVVMASGTTLLQR
jgi:uncharacterized protein (TIGR00369 family)